MKISVKKRRVSSNQTIGCTLSVAERTKEIQLLINVSRLWSIETKNHFYKSTYSITIIMIFDGNKLHKSLGGKGNLVLRFYILDEC